MSTILFVDDDSMLIQFGCFVLAEIDDLNIIKATEDFEAIDLARTYPGRIDLLLSDMNTSGAFGGLNLAEMVTQSRPDMKVLLMSGCSADQELLPAEWHFISKPFHPSVLLEKVGDALGRSCRHADR